MGQQQSVSAQFRQNLRSLSPAFAAAAEHIQGANSKPLAQAMADIGAGRLSAAADRIKALASSSHLAATADRIQADVAPKLEKLAELMAYAGPVATALMGAVGIGMTVLAAASIMSAGPVLGTLIALALIVASLILLTDGLAGIQAASLRSAR